MEAGIQSHLYPVYEHKLIANLCIRSLIRGIRDFWAFSEISKKTSKKCLTTFLENAIGLENFNPFVRVFHKLQKERG